MPYKFLIFLISSCYCISAKAQLQADFTVDKSGGCSPLSVQFTNTSTGTSAATTYDWVFGNGNVSKFKDPGANYLDEKTYTITLTIKDGANTSTKTMDITVFKKPTVDFSATGVKGCIPLTVSFTGNATAGDGTVAKYYWDFGDGQTTQSTNNTISHDYTFAQVPPISLTVTNSNGCYASVAKSNLIEAVKDVTASFSASTTALCKAGDAVEFTGTSTGGGTLTYNWDFGDGQNATEQSPTHVYAANGSYIVKLNVKSNYGCEANAQPVTINVANFIGNFDVPALICQNQSSSFINKSTTGYDSLQWWVDNAKYSSKPNDDLAYAFQTAGGHTVQLVAFYGNCQTVVSKDIVVNPLPQVAGFVADLQGVCGVPVTVNLKDTSTAITKWEWRIGAASSTVFATTQVANYTFTTDSSAIVFLTYTNTEGCSGTVSKTINYSIPKIDIVIKPKPGNVNSNSDCVGLPVTFTASPESLVKDFKWDFGDGKTSTESQPSHIFETAGKYTITLDYTTTSGCVGRDTRENITLIEKPTFDFTATNGTTICGNTHVTIKATAVAGWQYYWLFGDDKNYRAGVSSITRQFEKDTTYLVRMIASNGNCRDTVTKQNYLTVVPPFPKIKQAINTCADTRGMVYFVDSSRKALQWEWDFGDGVSDTYTTKKDTVAHLFNKSGSYKVILSTTNGVCTTKDSITAFVLLKQNPVLSADKTNICSNDSVSVGLNGLEPNPYLYKNTDSVFNYTIPYVQYGDFSSQPNVIPFTPNAERTAISAKLTQFISGKNGFRLITNSDYFNCADTTNFLPLKIHGPVAGFTIQPTSDCFKDAVFFKDTSHAFETTPITKWVWNFGDSTTASLTNGGNTSHYFKSPGDFYPSLTVTDADGCSSTTQDSLYKVSLKGPKADFYASSYTVAPDNQVEFFNSSPAYNNANSQLKWIFSDGSESTAENPSFFYAKEGSYIVKLITSNLQTACTDTATKTIVVKKPNSAFTYTLSYINNNNCPPVIAQFNSVSADAARLSWDFGDGSVAGNFSSVAHNYSQPGMYRVVHYSFDANNVVDSTQDFIEVKGPYALLKADTLYACNTLTVQLSAEVRHAKTFTWDFGDGALTAGTDTFAIHTYLTPGIYTPQLILKDEGGCTGNSVLPQKIIVDSLSGSLGQSPSLACTSDQILFVNDIQSLSKSQLQDSLQYRWIIANNPVADTFYTPTAIYSSNTAGQYPVGLRVRSSYGCEANITGQIDIKQGLKASIGGPLKICRLGNGTFTGNAQPYSDILQWQWNFGIDTSPLQNPPPKIFPAAGEQPVSLIVTNGFCADTAAINLLVQEIPAISFTPAQPFVCIGDSATIIASGGISYQWTPNNFIKNANQAAATVWPTTTTFYTVKATNNLGCAAKDSVEVKVITPLQVAATSPLFACAGNTVQLNATGAAIYQWQNSIGLSNTQIANPIAATLVNTSYTVIGSDSYRCFSDTATVVVRIGKLPTVQAGPDFLVKVGTEIRLIASASSDVIRYNWLPTDFLSCANCANTLSTPLVPTNYIITVTNNEGCTAKDSVRIELICTKDVIYIPTGFTPNGDNLNDRFTIRGSGIKSIRKLVIFDRWGKVVFERKNVAPYDRNSSWDGKLGGQPLPTGAYIYSLELECEVGEFFNYKGSVMLIR